MRSYYLVKKIIEDNAPLILSSVAVVGTVTTGYLATKAGWRSGEALKDDVFERTTADKIKQVAPYFLPAAGAGAATITCIVFSHKISAGRIAAMAAAYSLSENRLKEYKAKIEEKLGIEKKEEIEEELIHERLRSTPVPTFVFGNNDILCFDAHSGRYFKSSQSEILKAVNDTNFEVLNSNYATLEFFWDLIGLPPTAYSDEFGWSASEPLSLMFGAQLDGDDTPALVIKYSVEPIRRWHPGDM